MGLAVGAGFYECVTLAFVLIFLCMRILPPIESAFIERARFINLYVEFHSLDNVGTIISQIKSQDAQILDVDIARGHEEHSRNPSAVFSIRLNQRQSHTQMVAAIAKLDSIYMIDEI